MNWLNLIWFIPSTIVWYFLVVYGSMAIAFLMVAIANNTIPRRRWVNGTWHTPRLGYGWEFVIGVGTLWLTRLAGFAAWVYVFLVAIWGLVL